jgi:CheY-like chemotaxis protein
MNNAGPVIIIEDDVEDQEMLIASFKDLAFYNEIVFFGDGESAYNYLIESKEQPFLILSDINMPRLNGVELKEKIHNNEQLELKCIPYLFFTTSSDQKMVIQAYSKSAQGFFVKPSTYTGWLDILKNIIDYWTKCHSPRF